MIIYTNYQPDISFLKDKKEMLKYAKSKCRNKKELRALLIDIKRCPRGFVMFPGESSFLKCLNKYRKKREAVNRLLGLQKIDRNLFDSMRPQPVLRGFDFYLNYAIVCKKKKVF